MKKYIINKKMDNKDLKELIKELGIAFPNSKINFLLGSGFSRPILETLGKVEEQITNLENDSHKNKKVAIAVILWQYFLDCIYPLKNDITSLIIEQKKFKEVLYYLINNRSNPIQNKQLNIFTTNYDTILEMTFDDNKIFCNDGFEGNLKPIFSTSNFCKVIYKMAIFSDNKVEIPSVNIIKTHGSLTWEWSLDDEEKGITFSKNYRDKIDDFFNRYSNVFSSELESSKSCISNYFLGLDDLDNLKISEEEANNFVEEYVNNYIIVNPTKKKFNDTVFKVYYYEMQRIFSNALEKENTILFVFGFSFSDEHIAEITKRSLVNPSLMVYIFCYNEEKFKEMSDVFKKYANVNLIYIKDGKLNLEKFNKILSMINE